MLQIEQIINWHRKEKILLCFANSPQLFKMTFNPNELNNLWKQSYSPKSRSKIMCE